MPRDENERRRATEGRWLALIPASVAALMLALMMPRGTTPSEVPLPTIDQRALAQTIAEDSARARAARAERLSTDVLAVGTAFRALQRADAEQPEDFNVAAARLTLADAVSAVAVRPQGISDLVTLRAVQVDGFVAAVRHFEATGEHTVDLDELGGGFVRRMRAAGWIDGRRVLLDEAQRRVAFKLVWNALIGAETLPALAPTLDEHRALYALYIARPHAPEHRREEFEAERAGARTEADCERARGNERVAAELWRVDKVRKLGEIDPDYPTSYALGVGYYRAERYDLAIERFRDWLDEHPEGPLALRARNHLKASVAAYGPF